MTQHRVVLRIRALPFPIWAIQRLRRGRIDRMAGASSAQRSDTWFVFLVPHWWRSAHHWWARRRGFFWLPCVLCGRELGGHEWHDIYGKPASVPDPMRPNMHVGICPQCTRAGRGVAS